MAGVNSHKRVRLVKGSHIITKKWWEGDHGYVLQAPDKRLIFVNPYFDDLALIGTTDVPYDDRPEDVKISPQEVSYLIDILNQYFDIALSPDDVLSDYAGVRALFDDDSAKNASAVTRDYTFELDGGEGRAPMLSAFGGKITTYRKLAEAALEKLAGTFPHMSAPWTHNAPLPGGTIPDASIAQWAQGFAGRHPYLPPALAQHYATSYGTDADDMLADAGDLSALGEHFGALLYEREARWLMDNEWAQTPADILERRSKHGLFLTPDEHARFGAWMSAQRH